MFDFRFVNPPGRDGIEPPAGLGLGVDQDYRRIPSIVPVDTFKLRFQPGEGGLPMTLSWIPLEIQGTCDSARLRDEFGGFFVNANMLTTSSVVVPAPLPITTLLLFKYAYLDGISEVSVYNACLLGRKVATLVSQELTPGFYTATWNGTDQSGRTSASGIYFVRMTAAAGNAKAFTAMQKIMLLK